MFSRWGGFVYRRRRVVLLATLILAAAAAPLALGTADQLTAGGWLDPHSESAKVSDRLEAEFGGGRTAFVALFRADAPDADATSPAFQAAIAATVGPLADDERGSGDRLRRDGR
jgi:RND superfamily putative drug exporter